MQATIISDTSCLILLDRINELHLLQKLYGRVLITPIIADEFGVQLPEWIELQSPSNTNSQSILETSLDKGEASAIALALEKQNCLLIIDELKGRRLARQLGLNITGTLGIIAEAKRKGHLPSVRIILDKVKETDFRLSGQLEEALLKLVGE